MNEPQANQASPASDLATQCLWRGCKVQSENAEELYKHLCDDHVGRNSKNNLCLSCHWDGCQADYSKRDHITSHLRIHLPMKPFLCTVCGKKFKRSQDLKKHGRTHVYCTSQDDKPSEDAHDSDTSAPVKESVIPPSASVSMYPNLPTLCTTASRDNLAHTPSFRSTSSRESLSPTSSYSLSQDASPRGFAPVPHTEMVNSHFVGNDALYPPALKTYGFMDQYPGSHRASSVTDLDESSRTPTNLPMRNESWNVGSKRPRRAIHEFWEDVGRKKIPPTYDNSLAQKFDQLLPAECAQDIGSLDLFLGESLNAIGSFGVQDPLPMLNAPDRLYHPQAVPTADTHHSRLAMPQSPRSIAPNLADVNSWLVNVGLDMSRSWSSNADGHSPVREPQPNFSDFAQSLNLLGLANIPGCESFHLENKSIGNATGLNPSQDPLRGMPSHTLQSQLRVRDSGAQPTYRHVEPLTRAPVSLRSNASYQRATLPHDAKMDTEENLMDLPRNAPSLYPSLPDNRRATPMDERSSPSPPRHHEPSKECIPCERHLHWILNVLLVLNKRQRIDPHSGRIVPWFGDSRERSRNLYPPASLRRKEGRERSFSKPSLYDVSYRRNTHRDPASISHLSPWTPRPSLPAHDTTQEQPPSRSGALPSIAQLLSDVDMN
ncbi:hypothetical protein MYAM1_001246 [Malassezia yamatoensis]|uniref:C2H2-type domain-containing protein n=1 Tax=Malassezia yamatoensis TaxID=253288 RepID=A0AAJ6CH90_9BASI|nr:hypothetical protein MYAM1_001246 [Malassezia yamatoensis]